MLFKHDEYLFWVPIKKYQASQTTQSMHGGAPRTIPKFTILVLLAFTASPDVIHIGIHNNTDQHGATDQKLPCSHGNISVIYVYTRFGTAKRPWRGRRRRYRCARNFSTRRARALRTHNQTQFMPIMPMEWEVGLCGGEEVRFLRFSLSRPRLRRSSQVP